jgi:hypothetical protein
LIERGLDAGLPRHQLDRAVKVGLRLLQGRTRPSLAAWSSLTLYTFRLGRADNVNVYAVGASNV